MTTRDTGAVVAKCSAIARSGSRCAAPVLVGSSYCYLHAPEMAEARRQASIKGGKNRANKARAAKDLPDVLTPVELAAWLSHTFKRVITGQLEPKVGTAAAAIARALLDVDERATLEARIAELEAVAGIGAPTGMRRRAS